MPVDLDSLRADLAEEHTELDEIVCAIPLDAWDTPTPAEPWTVRDQITHLTYFDDRAVLAAKDPKGFQAHLAAVMADPSIIEDAHLSPGHGVAPQTVLDRWRVGRAAMLAAFAELGPEDRIAWYGPPMSAASFITARLMETWCHGQDVIDALQLQRRPTRRLRHIAHLGVRTRQFSYTVRGQAAPAGDVYVELSAPDRTDWRWGEAGASDRVRGDALDFCLVVTQRRHADDTGLRIEGPNAREWMSIAQAFAGPPGPGRRPGQFPRLASRA